MMGNSNKEEIPADELICPITLELFRDPVRAKDGRVYEKEAIVRWISQHGTSPFTRQPLQLNDLRPDERLKNLARARRGSTVSYNSHNEQVTLPPVESRLRNSRRIVPYTNGMTQTNILRRNQSGVKTLLLLFVSFIFPVSFILGLVIGLQNSYSQEIDITSRYSGQLNGNDSMYNLSSNSNSSSYYYYKTIEIIVLNEGFYGLEIVSLSSIRINANLYQNPFNNSNLSLNLLSNAYKSQIFARTVFGNRIQSQKYFLRITTYLCCGIGPFSISITGPNKVYFNPI